MITEGIVTVIDPFANVGWRKSTRSGNKGACVEVATVGNLVGIRDSKQNGVAGRPVLVFASGHLAALTAAIAGGQLAL